MCSKLYEGGSLEDGINCLKSDLEWLARVFLQEQGENLNEFRLMVKDLTDKENWEEEDNMYALPGHPLCMHVKSGGVEVRFR